MPLKKGYSHDVISSNVREMVKAGHKPKAAIAAALSSARKAKKMAEGGEVNKEKPTPSPSPEPHQIALDPDKAKAFSNAFKGMAEGGMVGDDSDLDEERERGLFTLMQEGDQPPVANPQTEDMEKHLALALYKKHEAEEYAMGGLIEGESDTPVGNKPSEGMDSSASEQAQPSEPSMSDMLSEEAMQALMEKKKKRRFM